MANPNKSGSYTCPANGIILYYLAGRSRNSSSSSTDHDVYIKQNGTTIQDAEDIKGSFNVNKDDVISYKGSWKIWNDNTNYGCVSI